MCSLEIHSKVHKADQTDVPHEVLSPRNKNVLFL